MTILRRRLLGALLALTTITLLVAPPAGAEATRPRLGAADEYAVVADQAISSSGETAITGSVAIAASSNLSGFPPGTIAGATHLADQEALDVAGATAAVNVDLEGQPCNSDRTGEDQGGLRLGEAVYCYVEPASLDGELRFDALGDPDAVWVLQIDGAYDVRPGSKMILANGAQACNVFWRVTGQMSVGAGSTLVGTFVGEENIVLGPGVTLDGRLFAPQGSVQLSTSTISQAACATTSDQVTTTTAAPTPTTAAPTTTPAPTVPPGTSGTGTGTGTGTGGDDGGLAATGPVSMLVATLAVAALAAGHALVGTERAVAWNARRWRPRHAAPRFTRLRRR